MEKEIKDLLSHSKGICYEHCVSKFKKECEEIDYESKKIKYSKYSKVNEIIKNVELFKKKFGDRSKIVVEEAQRFVSNLENQMTSCKEETIYDVQTIKKKIIQLENELKPISEQITRNQDKNKKNIKSKNEEKKEDNETDNAEDNNLIKIKSIIGEIDNELNQLGNRNLGWIKEDHDDFVKIFIKSGKETRNELFRTNLSKNFPLFSEDELNVHIEKFERMNFLEKQKKDLLEKYKNLQKKKGESQLISFKKKDVENTLSENQQRNINFQHHSKIVKEKLEAWEIEKKKMEMETKQKELLKLRLDKEKQEEERKRLLLEKMNKQAEIQKFREKKEIEELLKIEHEKKKKLESKKALSLQDLDRIKRKEEELTNKKIELIDKKRQNSKLKEERLNLFFNKIDEKYKHVENKFDQYTSSIAKKQTNKFNPSKDVVKDGGNFGGVLIRTEGRRLVAWRQNIN